MGRVVAVLVAALVVACGGGSGSTTPTGGAWVDQQVSFPAGGLTVSGTFRHPAGGPAVPAVLIIAGSGPTDRDGNSRLISGRVDTLRTLADWLSADGVASLRYDKLGTGQTGLGPYASNVTGIDVTPFEQEAAAALTYLAGRPGIDRGRLAVVGHSEGALYALLLATGTAGPAPPVHALGLLEPLSRRYLDVIAGQIDAQVAAQRQAGQLTDAQVAQIQAALSSAVESLRTSGTVPANLPFGLANALSPANARYLSEADRFDPAQLAAGLRPHLPVLVSCSDADIQVSCADVDHLAAGLAQPPADTDLVRLTGVDHVLKEDPSRTGARYADPLPFSSQLRRALAAFANRL